MADLVDLDYIDHRIDIARGKAAGTEVLIGTETLAALVRAVRIAVIVNRDTQVDSRDGDRLHAALKPFAHHAWGPDGKAVESSG